LNGRSSGEQSRSVEGVQESDHRHRRLLRPRRERPRSCRAAEKRDEFASPHSITSSARASSAGFQPAPCWLGVRSCRRAMSVACGCSLLGIMKSHADARLRVDARGRDGGVRFSIACMVFCQAKPDLRHVHQRGSRLRVRGGARHLQTLMLSCRNAPAKSTSHRACSRAECA
jgi:hypothetical protein